MLSILFASTLAITLVACSDSDDASSNCDPTDEVCKCECYTSCLADAGSNISKAVECVDKCMEGKLVADSYCEGVLSAK